MKTWVTFLFINVFYLSFGNNPETAGELNTAANVSYLSPIEKEVVYEINLFRSNPAKYANDFIEPLAKYYKNKILNYPNDRAILTIEGVKALNECVKVLNKESPKPILYPNNSLSNAASDHQTDQSQTGKTGHTGSNNSTFEIRIKEYGDWQKYIAENIAYGNSSARQVVIFLLVDDGVQNRGHRNNLLNPEINLVGVSYGSHPVYSTMCVMDFAGGMKEK